MYDYMLGGKDNFASDREAAERSIRAVPQLPWFARENRKFLGRVVRFCADAGVSQFLDIGSGLPTMENVHQVAERATANPRVVYVDNDPVVVSHSRALLATSHTAAIFGDVTRPQEILQDAEVRDMLDFSKPVAILLIAVFISFRTNSALGRAWRRCERPWFPAVSWPSRTSGSGPVRWREPLPCPKQRASSARPGRRCRQAAPVRDNEQIGAFFGDFTVIDPGLVDVWDWRPDDKTFTNSSDIMTLTGGLARKDGSPAAAVGQAR